jgi:hypothetical protein
MVKAADPTSPRLGLRQNLGQFALLVVVNGFVGAMVGLERSILPAIAEEEFHLAARFTWNHDQQQLLYSLCSQVSGCWGLAG